MALSQTFETIPEFDAAKAEVRHAVEAYLADSLARLPENEVRDAAAYAVLGGGHRWRAIVAVAAGRIFRPDALEIVLPFAGGVELAHAASLVLDDLPSMDDASLRRGKPCAHRIFPAWAVDMTPVYLVALAYRISLDNPRASAERRVEAAIALSHAALEMIGGQVRDMRQDGGSEPEILLLDCYRLKSSALYGAAAMAGAVLCGASASEAERIRAAGVDLGLSYQFLDDVADVAEVGKEGGRDADKRTAIDLFGIEGATRKSVEFQSRALSHLGGFGTEADWLRTLISEASWKAS